MADGKAGRGGKPQGSEWSPGMRERMKDQETDKKKIGDLDVQSTKQQKSAIRADRWVICPALAERASVLNAETQDILQENALIYTGAKEMNLWIRIDNVGTSCKGGATRERKEPTTAPLLVAAKVAKGPILLQ